MRLSPTRTFLVAGLVAVAPTVALALPALYTITLEGVSGTLGANAFTERQVTFRVSGDTDDIYTSGDYHELLSAPAEVTIASLGTYVFTGDSYVWTNLSGVGLFDYNWNDIVYGSELDETTAADSTAFDLTTDISLAFSSMQVYDDSFYTIATTGGNLVLTADYVPGTFVAEIGATVPLPAAAPLLGMGLAALGLARRRRGRA